MARNEINFYSEDPLYNLFVNLKIRRENIVSINFYLDKF